MTPERQTWDAETPPARIAKILGREEQLRRARATREVKNFYQRAVIERCGAAGPLDSHCDLPKGHEEPHHDWGTQEWWCGAPPEPERTCWCGLDQGHKGPHEYRGVDTACARCVRLEAERDAVVEMAAELRAELTAIMGQDVVIRLQRERDWVEQQLAHEKIERRRVVSRLYGAVQAAENAVAVIQGALDRSEADLEREEAAAGAEGTASEVWVVERGEQHEGGSVMGAYRTREAAEEAALGIKCHFDGGWEASGENRWENGCDYVEINRMEVE